MLKHLQTYFNNLPGYLIFYVTNRCNFRCKFCYYSDEIQKGRKVDELKIDEIEKISKNCKNIIQISMAGGEPFLRNDFNEITKIFVKNSNVKYINIPTNGSLTSRMVKYLEEILPVCSQTSFRLTFSIDGIEGDHDENRSMKGSFQRIIKSYNAIKHLREKYKNLSIDSNTVFTTKTENNIINIIKYLNSKFDFDNNTVTYARGSFPDKSLKSKSKEKYDEAVKYLNTQNKNKENRFLYPIYRSVRNIAFESISKIAFDDEFVVPCVAVKKLLVISEEGNVYPCETLTNTHLLGNLRDYNYNLNNILDQKYTNDTKNWIKDTKCKCTFECAVSASIAWSPKKIPKILTGALKNI